MRTLIRIGIVWFLCMLALAYLGLHNRSLRLTRLLSTCEGRHRHLLEQRDSLAVLVMRLESFSRLESLWVASGRPRYSAQEDAIAVTEPDTGPVIVAQAASRGEARQ